MHDLIIFQKAQSHISTVFDQFSYLNSSSQLVHPPDDKNTIPQPNLYLGLFLNLNTCRSSKMSDVAQPIKNLSKKFNNLQKDVDKIKKSAKKKKHSRQSSRSSWKSRSQSQSTSRPPNPSTSRGDPNNSRRGAHGRPGLPVLGVEHVATHPAMDAPTAPFTVLPPPGVAFPQLNRPGAAREMDNRP